MPLFPKVKYLNQSKHSLIIYLIQQICIDYHVQSYLGDTKEDYKEGLLTDYWGKVIVDSPFICKPLCATVDLKLYYVIKLLLKISKERKVYNLYDMEMKGLGKVMLVPFVQSCY